MRRRLPLALSATALLGLAAAGCGEKSEPPIRPPTTVAPTTTVPTPPSTATSPTPTPTAPAPQTTP